MAGRTCRCGCGASLDGLDPRSLYVDRTHAKRVQRRVAAAPAVVPPSPPGSPAPDKVTRDEADRRKAVAQAELAELELARARGDLVAVKESEDRIARFVASVRAQLLAVVGDIRQEMPGLSREQIAKVDALVRRRLEVTAGAAEAGEL